MAKQMQDRVMFIDGLAVYLRLLTHRLYKLRAECKMPGGNQHDNFHYANKAKHAARVAAKKGGRR